MTIKNILSKWMDFANEDLTGASELLKVKRYLLALFHCHQAIEKLLKAVYISKISKDYPYVHDLPRLYRELDGRIELKKEFLTLCEKLNPFYIKARYPTYKEKISSMITPTNAVDLFLKTEEFYKWLEKEMIK